MHKKESKESWDHIIVGGGSAGAVLASRLSEQSGRRVLLIEAGPDFPHLEQLPAVLKNAAEPVFTGFNWEIYANLRTTSRWRDLVRSAPRPTEAVSINSNAVATAAALRSSPVPANPELPFFVGKVMGGSSAINGAMAFRGVPDDFAQWASEGNNEWSWDRVLPYYKKIEADQDFPNETHGTSGPLPINRWRDDELYILQRAFLDACMALGLPEIADLNGNDKVGVGKTPMNTKNHHRISTATSYLDVARSRSNLKILSHCTVQKVLFDGKRAIGVEVSNSEGCSHFFGNTITLSAGAIHTPAILQRSGIGNAQLCRALGITPLADLPGVGENLCEHVSVALWAIPKPGVCEAGQHFHQTMARIASNPSELYDVQLLPLSSVPTQDSPFFGNLLEGAPLATGIAVMLSQPLSRGRVFIHDPSYEKQPAIELNVCSDERDIERLMYGVRQTWKILNSTQMSPFLERIFLWTENMVNEDRLLRKAVTNFVSPTWHPVGTAKLGPASDRMAVVDQYLRVHGIDGLNVVDASVMPVMPRAPTNLTCIMIAERAAEWMMQ
ncbi:MAG: GMC family oxidoreductase [Pseudomonadota bacterium]